MTAILETNIQIKKEKDFFFLSKNYLALAQLPAIKIKKELLPAPSNKTALVQKC